MNAGKKLVPEQERLQRQYDMRKKIYGRTSPLPDSVDINQVRRVIDVAAGTCAWALEFAALPQVRGQQGAIEIHVCDVDTACFPPSSVLDAAGLKPFAQDITQPFPDHLGQFDIVHASLLFLYLTEEDWKAALTNLRNILKPNGVILLEEVDPILLTELQDRQRREDSHGDAIQSYMKGSTWRDKANSLYTGYMLRKQRVVGLSFRLPELANALGLAVSAQENVSSPWGKLCAHRAGSKGDSLAEYEAESASNLGLVFSFTGSVLAKENILEIPFGNAVDNGVLPAVLNEIQEGLRSEGAMIQGSQFELRRM
ncbi:S-adenosyl-L-methionine-dependent methyltransferase [Mycena indigotica]|uniref:S-adenosyl-L-methionine-dependent methyltransferase n=1 Tax=Mycena indigotica TaxID=2126181 RepID=A0A8H6SJT0_9AGAR|nr:S-adenosyl-L-methionine-dependent methyltransferase [Mycena indigotica]KAF7300995.1 S-adenosyl-L-methionine-dependent methyltransferase [Mycena indigotica]